MKNRALFAFLPLMFVSLSACAGQNGTFVGPGTGQANAILQVAIPVPTSGSGRSQFVVAQTQGLHVRVTASNVVAPVVDSAYDVSSSSVLCTTSSNTRTCRIAVSLNAGTFRFAFQSYNAAPANGVIPGNAQLLAAGNLEQTLPDGTTTIRVALDGTPASLAVTPKSSVVIAGSPAAVSLAASAHDASNNTIVGSYATPVTATVVDTGGHTKLSIDNGVTRSAAVTLTSSTDASHLTAYFDGGGTAGYVATVTLSASGTASVSAALNRFTVTGTALFGTPTFAEGAPANARFSAPAQQIKLVAGEPGYSGTFTIAQNTCGGIAAVIDSAPAFTLVTTSYGVCAMKISDGTNVYPINVAVTVSQGTAVPPSGTVREYAGVAGLTPTGMTTGSDGNLWVVGYTSTAAYISRVVPATGAVTSYALTDSNPDAIASGADGNLWVLDATSNTVSVLSTSGNQLATHTTGSSPFAIALGSEGAMWVTNTNDDTVTCYPVVGSATTYPIPNSGALTGIAAGPDGALWVTDLLAQHVSRVSAGCATPAGGSVTQPTGVPFPSGSAGIVAGPDDAVWFTETIASTVGRMSMSGAYSDLGTLAQLPAASIIKGPDLNLWYSGCTCVGSLVRVTPSGTVTPFTSGITATGLTALTSGPDGGVWYAGSNGSAAVIGRLQP